MTPDLIDTAVNAPNPFFDYSTWGVETQGYHLLTNPTCWLGHSPWVIDVENNPDGSFAGMGLYSPNAPNTVVFFTHLLRPDWFVGQQFVGHNIKYDVQMLRKWGINVSPDQIVWDTQLAEYVKDSTKFKYGLKDIAKERFGATYPTFKELTGKGKKAVPIGSLPADVVANYNGCDVLYTAKLYYAQLGEMSDEQKAYMERIELPTMRVLLEMEERGVQIDASYIRGIDVRLAEEISSVSASIRSICGDEVNFNSPIQVKRFLLDKAGLSLKSTAAEELRKHKHIPLVKSLLRYRELAKLKGTYTEGLIERSQGQETYRLHARFNQSITQTGRLSSSDPNLQNIPTRTEEGDAIRQAFVAVPDHVLVDADYSQIEPRLMAHFSQDTALLAVFREGKDLYDAVSAIVGCERPVSKTLWLAMAYNAGAFKIAMTANISVPQAERFLTKMKLAFQQFFYWRSKVIAKAEIDGGVRTLFGRWIPLPADLAHLAPNYEIQGSAGEINKLGLVACREYVPVINVHDETLFEVEKSDDMLENYAQSCIRTSMENVVSLSVPLKVEVGTASNWAEAKK